MEHVDWHIDWADRWLRFAKEHLGRVVFSFHGELADPQALLARVLKAFGTQANGTISSEPNEHDRFRKKTVNDWRHGLSSTAQQHLTERVRAGLADYPEFDRLWS